LHGLAIASRHNNYSFSPMSITRKMLLSARCRTQQAAPDFAAIASNWGLLGRHWRSLSDRLKVID
jgi:hypothetical protein